MLRGFACGQGLALFALLYPLSVLTGIVVTGNHFIFDAVCGSVALAAGTTPSYHAATRGAQRCYCFRVVWRPISSSDSALMIVVTSAAKPQSKRPHSASTPKRNQ